MKCSIESCKKDKYCKGYCLVHYQKNRKYGNPLAGPGSGAIVQYETCTVRLKDNRRCLQPHRAKGLCQMHYKRKKLYGDVHANPRGVKGQKQKYKLIRVMGHPNASPTGWIAEHRYFMSEHIGRPLADKENVHHKNGNRLDNRIENLELWNVSQPAGQRPEDKVKYAKEILKLYAPEYLKEQYK